MAVTNNPLLQQIDAIAKEKGVEPEVIITAVQDAIEAAARKRYKNETLRAKFNTETGQIELCAVKRIVEEVTDPPNQISLAEAQQLYGEEAEGGMEIDVPRRTADRAVADRPGPAHQALRAGSAGDLRRHRGHPWRRTRGGRPRQGRGLLARAGRRPGRRLRRHEGDARAVDHPRPARREDRHRR